MGLFCASVLLSRHFYLTWPFRGLFSAVPRRISKEWLFFWLFFGFFLGRKTRFSFNGILRYIGGMPQIADRIREKIETQLQTTDYVLTDESGKHAGHAGARPEGETHFHLRVVAPVFSGLSRVARQRLIYDLLKAEMDERVHALSLELKSPDEV